MPESVFSSVGVFEEVFLEFWQVEEVLLLQPRHYDFIFLFFLNPTSSYSSGCHVCWTGWFSSSVTNWISTTQSGVLSAWSETWWKKTYSHNHIENTEEAVFAFRWIRGLLALCSSVSGGRSRARLLYTDGHSSDFSVWLLWKNVTLEHDKNNPI